MNQLTKSATRFDKENEGYGNGEPELEYLPYEGLWKISGGINGLFQLHLQFEHKEHIKLGTATVTPPLTVILFAGPMRMRNDIIEDFELGTAQLLCPVVRSAFSRRGLRMRILRVKTERWGRVL